MSHVQAEPLIEDYLRRLDAAGWALPPHRRRDLVAEIGEHIDDALRAEGGRGQAAVRNVLDRLGPPEEIAAAAVEGTPSRSAGPPFPAGEPRRVGAVEIAALVSFGIGVVSYGLGSAVGLVLVWTSRLWTRHDKIVATTVVAGSALLSALALMPAVPLWLAAVLSPLVMVALGSIAAACYLGIRSRRLTATA